jgi:hypothetical protein
MKQCISVRTQPTPLRTLIASNIKSLPLSNDKETGQRTTDKNSSQVDVRGFLEHSIVDLPCDPTGTSPTQVFWECL